MVVLLPRSFDGSRTLGRAASWNGVPAACLPGAYSGASDPTRAGAVISEVRRFGVPVVSARSKATVIRL